jgi:hypothetical protein
MMHQPPTGEIDATPKITQRTPMGIIAGAACLLLALGACNKSQDTTNAEPLGEPSPSEQSAPTAPPQTEQPTEQAPPTAPGEPALQPGAAAEVSDENLEKFAKASIAIQAMSPQYEERLKNAKTPEEGNQIQLEATEAVSKEVEKQGMSFEEFTTIAMQLESSPELQQRLTQKLQGMQE